MIISKIFTKKKLAIDFGTANCIILESGRGIVLREPTVVAISPKEKKVLAVGEEAKLMLGKVPEGVEARRPLKHGGIANFRLAEALLRKYFNKVLGQVRLVRPIVIVSIPAGINSVEERAILQALKSVGAGFIYLLPEPIAAAVGAGMPINTSSGNLIVNLGGGTAEIAILSLNGVVSVESHRGAGDAINDEIANFVKNKYGVLIGEQTAEKLKIVLGTVMQPKEEKRIDITGKSVKNGQPQTITLSSAELVEPIRAVMDQIANSIKRVLSKAPPELMSDIIDRGMVLSGGTAQLRSIDEFLTKSIGIPAHVVDDPMTCVVRGLEKILDNIDDYKRSVKS